MGRAECRIEELQRRVRISARAIAAPGRSRRTSPKRTPPKREQTEKDAEEHAPQLLWEVDRVHMRNRLPIFSSTWWHAERSVPSRPHLAPWMPTTAPSSAHAGSGGCLPVKSVRGWLRREAAERGYYALVEERD